MSDDKFCIDFKSLYSARASELMAFAWKYRYHPFFVEWVNDYMNDINEPDTMECYCIAPCYCYNGILLSKFIQFYGGESLHAK